MYHIDRRLAPALLLASILSLAALALGQLATATPAVTIQDMINVTPDGGTVHIPAGTFFESLTVDRNITLSGVSSTTTEIRAVAGQRVITVTAGHDLRLVNLTITGGHPSSEVGGGIKLLGGSLFVDDCLISGNSADYGGAIFQDGGSYRVRLTGSRVAQNSATWDGGGIFVRGALLLQQTDVLSNTAGRHGGGIHAEGSSVDITGGLFTNDRASGGNGGAIDSNNALSISGTRFITNSASQFGGAVLQWNAGWPVTISNAVFENNGSKSQGGGLWARGNVTIAGGILLSNSVVISGANTEGGGAYLGGATADISGVTARANEARCQDCALSAGGALSFGAATSGSVRKSTFESNYAWSGGAVSSGSSTLSVRDSVFTRNSAGYGGGLDASNASIRGVQFLSNTALNRGGALVVGGNLTVEQTLFSANTANGGGGAVWASGPTRAENSAFLANAASQGGSALLLENPIARSLSQLTIAMPGTAGGEAIRVTQGNLFITNTIVASHSVGVSVTAGAVASADGMLWFNTASPSGGMGTFGVANQYIGTPAFTADGYHLLPGSMAIDHGVASGIKTDIDGNARPWGAGHDIGAVEYPRGRGFLPLLLRQ